MRQAVIFNLSHSEQIDGGPHKSGRKVDGMENELAAFENFKFELGDIVRFKSDINDCFHTVVERSLVESPEGITRAYTVRGAYGSKDRVYEMELDDEVVVITKRTDAADGSDDLA